MHDAFGVCDLEGARDLMTTIEDLIERWIQLCRCAGERDAVHVLHGEKRGVAVVLQRMDGGNVRVVEAGQKSCLGLETAESVLVIRQAGRKDFDRDLPTKVGIDA